jgi:hypothetical protein
MNLERARLEIAGTYGSCILCFKCLTHNIPRLSLLEHGIGKNSQSFVMNLLRNLKVLDSIVTSLIIDQRYLIHLLLQF